LPPPVSRHRLLADLLALRVAVDDPPGPRRGGVQLGERALPREAIPVRPRGGELAVRAPPAGLAVQLPPTVALLPHLPAVLRPLGVRRVRQPAFALHQPGPGAVLRPRRELPLPLAVPVNHLPGLPTIFVVAGRPAVPDLREDLGPRLVLERLGVRVVHDPVA